MERELTTGKVIDKPSIWNKDTLLGGLIGSFLGSFIGVFQRSRNWVSSLALAGGVVAGTAIGAAHGKKNEEKEYAEALKQRDQQSKSISVAIPSTPEYEQNNGKSYTAKIQEERVQAQSSSRQK